MNTLSIPTTISTSAAAAPARRVADSAVIRGRNHARWLPAPAAPRRAASPRQASSVGVWLIPPRQSAGERVTLALLAAAALVSIGYGFVCLLNLVQNWAVFHAGIATLVQ